MKIKNSIIISALFLLMTGCLGSYGKIVEQSDNAPKVTITDLKQSWNQYHVYSGSRDGVRPSALMFDPKENDTKLTGDSWIKIDDEKKFLDTLGKVNLFSSNARIKLIKGQDEKMFGFLYYPPFLHVPVKIIDANTLYIMALPQPVSAK